MPSSHVKHHNPTNRSPPVTGRPARDEHPATGKEHTINDLLQVGAIVDVILTGLWIVTLLTPHKPRPPIHEPRSNITTTERTS